MATANLTAALASSPALRLAVAATVWSPLMEPEGRHPRTPPALAAPLASPGGAERLCELCQERAHVQCAACRVTFYCDAEHQRADWIGIHERICQLLVPIRSPAPGGLQRTGRADARLRKAELIDICSSVARARLSEGGYQEALPAAQFCLRCSVDVHGPGAVQLVPACLLLADAHVGLGNPALAAELLSRAEWAVLKSPECGHAVRHRLHRSLGRLHAATGNLEAALVHFANDIYFASEEYGVDSTVACAGYFLMADVFAKQGKAAVARSLYSEVAQTWHCRLSALCRSRVGNARENPGALLESSLDKAQQAEADRMLRAILESEQGDLSGGSGQVALAAHSLAMLRFLGGDGAEAPGSGSAGLQRAGQPMPDRDLTGARPEPAAAGAGGFRPGSSEGLTASMRRRRTNAFHTR